MEKNKFKTAIKYLPEFFETQLQNDLSGAVLFETIKNIIDFNEGYIFYLNPDSIQLKYSYKKNQQLPHGNVFYINDKIKKEILSSKSEVLDERKPIINLLKIKNQKSFLISKLAIRGTVYGFVLLCKGEKSFYGKDEIEVMNTVSTIISYLIKDIELSNVFKIQLKALKNGIVETNAAYKTIKAQNLKIIESDRIKNEFLANISHELRTPLNAIIGFSEVLSAGLFGTLNPKQTDYVKDIHISGIHLLGMINEILDISKIEAKAMTLNCSTFQLSKAVDEVLNVIKPLADKKNINIEKTIPNDGKVFADFLKISQILYNLVSNAIKFTDKKGSIQVFATTSKDKFVLKVTDNGIGIDEKYHGKIFAKFVQLESSYTKKESSTGLGLTITKELTEMHGGEISLVSEVDKGTTFTVTIPQRDTKNA